VTDTLRDIVLAVRRLRAAPTFTAFSVITLAVGIGMTTAIYALIQGTLLRPPQIRDIHEVVNIYHSNPLTGAPGGSFYALSRPDVDDLAAAQSSFSHLAAWRRARIFSDGGRLRRGDARRGRDAGLLFGRGGEAASWPHPAALG
jgi:hypothetical protein